MAEDRRVAGRETAKAGGGEPHPGDPPQGGGAAGPALEFLLEIGVEELPARFCPLALEQLRDKGEALLTAARLPCAAARTCGSPRRLAWLVSGLPARQADTESVARGPARAAAFDPAGEPTAAALGFARSQGVSVADLRVEPVGGREYVFARRVVPGLPTAEVLARDLPGLIAGLEFPRSMRWGTGDLRFARPVRWLVALLGAEVVPFTLEDLESGRTTQGHRTLHPGPHALPHAAGYPEALRALGVEVDVALRRQAIWSGVVAAVEAIGGTPRPNEDLLEEVTHINEWPTAFVGSFDAAALEVPEAVLVTVMRTHQRYFPVEGPDGRLLPHFAGVRNGGTQNLPGVAKGNEKVLAARFADARFFYAEDRAATLASRLPQLGSVAFAEGLGTLADKTDRLVALAGALARRVGVDPAATVAAARLCKADRVTHLVYEFPELEGTMGAHYAEADGEAAAVAQAIGEHVLPRAAGGDLPRSPAGLLLALADRLDTLAGHFLLGRQPTGSTDPLGLRRAGAAVVRLLEAAGWDLGFTEAVEAAAAGYADRGGEPSELVAFLVGRLRVRLEEAGFRHDIVLAVLAAGAERVADALRRCRALAAAEAGEGWEDTLTAFKRAANLARQGEPGGAPDPAALGHPTGRALWQALGAARRAAERAGAAGDHAGVLAATASLRRPVDDFLTAVLVMDPDPAVRRNRLALLAAVAALPGSVADLRLISGAERAGGETLTAG